MKTLRIASLSALALALLGGGLASATQPPSGLRAPTASKSLGTPNAGKLQSGLYMRDDSAAFHFKWGSPPQERYGTEELVGLVRRATGEVHRQTGAGSLAIGDLSRQRGGRIGSHSSHRSGRDADIGFYFVSRRSGQPVRTSRFYDVRRDGTAGHTMRFDDARNWKLVEALVTDPQARVKWILVAEHVERRLLAEARRQGASRAIYERARYVMFEPSHGGAHAGHFHVRIACPADDAPQCGD